MQAPRQSGFLLDAENLLLLGLELLFGEQALILHHRELLNLHQLGVQAVLGRGRRSLLCLGLLCGQGLLLRCKLGLLRLQVTLYSQAIPKTRARSVGCGIS